MIRALLALLAIATMAVWATAVASAQEAPFAFEDAALDAMPPPANAYADLVSGQAVVEGDAVRFTISLTALPEFQPGTAYGAIYSNGSADWYAVAVGIPEVTYFAGLWEGDGPSNTYDVTGSYTTGPGATVTIDVPLSLFAGVESLETLRAMSAEVKTGLSPVELPLPFLIPLDEATGSGSLALPRPAPGAEPAAGADEAEAPAAGETAAATPAPSPGAPSRTPAPGAAGVLLAGLVALVATRRSRGGR